ncbi:NAD(P)H-dependent oxidoreductase [Mesosutterella sp. OilRF-GAM-744-9]|uniref:NAD(P)H-dependent oxidoreductase n=1 Tax=Mesosutterella porci TaxID=2915351 RepID=A0ABS9MTG1_9BURK|nr:NAD(P)H-dependent oxidoreductase [Mesosutterella sp. oilRF-744-WT-GAM-9]MCG5031530.1 NAD(P)H-dependent oxidoreductase [Mesosutterella sp. oilRF-744-WT-GAM-9]
MKILIIDSGLAYGSAQGGLNHLLADTARETLEALGHKVQITRLQDPYDPEKERQKILWTDAVIYQFPVWWMEPPAALKSYEDRVFGPGMITGDGRHRDNPEYNYGTGGLLTEKRYMISATWNAPRTAFTDPKEFFEGRGMDATFFGLHKASQFLGMKPLPSFACNDVMKNPKTDSDLARWKEHLTRVFGKA